MPGATWDMITDGDDAGQIIRPPQYTATDDDATRVELWVDLATPAGTYVYRTSDGLDHALLLDPQTTDEERQERVRVRVLAHERVVEVTEVTIQRGVDDGFNTIAITASYTTISGTSQTVGFAL